MQVWLQVQKWRGGERSGGAQRVPLLFIIVIIIIFRNIRARAYARAEKKNNNSK